MTNGESRWLDVAPERIERWLGDFADRHGETTTDLGDDRSVVTVRAADGAVAECHVPFPPLPPSATGRGPELAAPELAAREMAAREMAAHAAADRLVAVLLVRLGGYAAGVFSAAGTGAPLLVSSKVGSRLVHGRSAAGGQSQQRFARRREKQAREAIEAAADCAATIFEPFRADLDALVTGGDRRSIAAVRQDARLRPYFEIATDRFLVVPDPRLAVLQAAPALFRAVRIRLTEP